MKIRLKNGKRAREAAIAAIESSINCVLCNSFKVFVQENDGAEPETNIFTVRRGQESGVNRFIPAAEIPAERTRIENIPEKAYPFAWAEGGNYVFIDEAKNGNVFFWDHENPEAVTFLASDFRAFLDLLEPFDAASIQLKPGQLKKAWIDPEFLKRLKK